MPRWLMIGLCVVWLATVLACTGAGGKWFDLPGGQAIYRSDYRDYYFYGENGVPQVRGHITDVGFDHRFILLRRDVCRQIDGERQRRHDLTGVIEFYIVEVAPLKLHGPFTEAKLGAARERLAVPTDLALGPTDKVRSRVGPPRE
jgi:hypothetical protein